MKYPILTFIDEYKKGGLELVFLLDKTYYHMVFETVLGFVSVSSKIKTTEEFEFDDDGYILKLKNSEYLDSFKDSKGFSSKTTHYAIKCKDLILHIVSNCEPKVNSKK